MVLEWACVVCNRVLPGKTIDGTKREGHSDLAGKTILEGYVKTVQGPQLGPARDRAVGVLRPQQKMKVALLELACVYRNSYSFSTIGKVITCQ